MPFVEYFKNDILCALSALEEKDFNTQESRDYLVSVLTQLINSTSDLETNKFVLTSLLFKIWQQHKCYADQLDYNILKVNYELSTGLYLELIEKLNMENEFRKLLYSIPQLTVQRVVENVIYSNPSYGFRIVYDPALNVCNSHNGQNRSELISSLLQMIVEYDNVIKTNDQLLVELFQSTARHVESHLNSNSPLRRKPVASQNSEIIPNNVEMNYFFSTFYYPDLNFQAKSHLKRAYQTVKSKSTQFENTSKSIESLYANSQRTPRDNKHLYQLLCIFDYLAFVVCKDEQQAYQINPLMKLAMRRVILRLKEADIISTLSSLNKIYSNENKSIDNLLEYIDSEPQKTPSNLEFRSKRIVQRLREDKSEYQNVTFLKVSFRMNSTSDEPLNKHEEAFITICHSLRQNLDYDISFANRIDGSELTFKLSMILESLTKKDLSSYCHWVVNSIRFRRLGSVSFLKLMLQYIDLFDDLNINEDMFSELIVEYGFQRELYQSIKRLIKNSGGKTVPKIKTGMNLFLKSFSLLSRHTKCLFRDFMLSDRPPDTNFKAPTFDNWSVWPFEYNQRLTTLCNQIVFTAEINSQMNDDKSKLIIKNKEECIRSSDIDALIELSMVASYFMLDRLLEDCIHNKGEGILILDILREIGSLCWFRQTSKSPALMIKVIQYKLSSLDGGTLCFNLQEQKNLIDFLMLAMTGNTTKKPVELTLMDIGEWNNNNILIDVREYIKYCVMPYLKSSNLIGRKITLSISLDILNALLFQLTPMLPPADVSWLMRSNPFSLLKSIVTLFNRRKEMFSLVINKIDNIYIVSKKLIEILAGCISSLPEDYVQYNIHNSDTYSVRQFYDESQEFDWTTQLFLRNLFEMCEDRLGLKIGKPIIPAVLFSFCDLSKEEFVIIEDNENMSEQTTEFKQTMVFLEGCRVSNDWCKKFSLALNKSQAITKPSLRNLFRTTAPLAFCYILANSVEEETLCLLNELLRELFFYGCLSAAELLMIDDNDNELNELATADLAFDERISLCCLRFSFINILESLHFLKEQQEKSNNSLEYEQQFSSYRVVTDFRIIQNIIKVTKEFFITPNSTLNYLIVLFYTITQALPLLSFSFKAEESLYIFLLFIVDQIDNARIITIQEEKSSTGIVVGNTDNGSSSNQKSRKKKKKTEKHQKGNQELEQQLEQLTREIDTTAIKADEVYIEANTKRNQTVRSVTIEYSQWQEKLLAKGSNKIKNNELGWRFTVANALKIRDELIDHGK
ncbi:unnamed protein product [Rhizophagus irregularis]|nr:unnamed protein product [Rhizophagus irregularis]CAB5351677.1 unnamed protein product [Rhizophagus irregularis]